MLLFENTLSALFQDFYTLASSHISTHISTLSSRQHRDVANPSPSSSRSSSLSQALARNYQTTAKDDVSSLKRTGSEQQMLTAAEISDRKRARALLERKRLWLEEDVERRVCERIYDRIWRHRSTQDQERDEKLRSRTAALVLVGIGLRELGIDLPSNNNVQPSVKEEEVRAWLGAARESLCRMNDEKGPLGKLTHLKAAHKAIVDTLSRIHYSSSSADEILPTLIYTLMTTPADGINVISNLNFIQRFRMAKKVDGEAAYCLTNLEAAITFLETVDLASLRSDESLAGPPKSSSSRSSLKDAVEGPSTSITGNINGEGRATPPIDKISDVAKAAGPATSSAAEPTPQHSSESSSSSLHHRRLSHLLQPPTQAFGAASDAVLSRADQGFKTIGNTLESSYSFLFGRLRERQLSSAGVGDQHPMIVPKTLDDARKLVSTPPPGEIGSLVDAQTLDSEQRDPTVRTEDGFFSLISGRKTVRERSADSARSGGSSSRNLIVNEAARDLKGLTNVAPTNQLAGRASPAMPLNGALNAVESMKNLGNTLNPLNRLGGMNVMRSFGRSTHAAAPSSSSPISSLTSEQSALSNNIPAPETQQRGSNIAPPDIQPPPDMPKVAPPIQRFIELESPGELRINEVLDLLRDYRRLAQALQYRGAF
ncbi:MAG: hypothetical protein M1817_002859 [Caeruleum heppii]|nr:MAG: hypothetical protein M1817_002859 [Caeruleum heppii]